MALTPSTMLPLGTVAPDFSLPNPKTGQQVSLKDFTDAKALVVAFYCNHCPYVIHLKGHFAQFARKFQKLGVAFVAINSNDTQNYQADSPENMVRDAETFNYPFPYLLDQDQSTAKAYQAACTPDFYLFDGKLKLVYRGQYDNSRPGSKIAVSGADLAQAIKAILQGKPVDGNQIASMGCNIKWKPGNAPAYFG